MSLSIKIISSFLLTSLMSCGGGGGGGYGSNSGSDTGSGSSASSNALVIAYPNTLAIAVLPQSVDTALRLSESSSKTVAQKIKETEEKLSGNVLSCLSEDMFRQATQGDLVSCYQFDSDMNPSQNGGGPLFGTTDGTVGGSIRSGAPNSEEACMVAFARQQVNEAVDSVDRSLNLISGLLCQAKKEGLDSGLPAVDGTLDLRSSLTAASAGFLTVNSASIKRLSDIDAKAVYKTDISIKMPDGENMEVHLVHSPGEGDEGNGVLYMKRSNVSVANDGGNNSANKNFVMSINYDKTTEDSKNIMRFEVRRAAIVNTVAPFTARGLVNYGGVSNSASNSEIHAINYLSFDLDVDSGAGDLSYWMNPGGGYNEAARGFIFQITEDTNSRLKGCGISGAASNLSIRKALAEGTDLKPSGYWHPFINYHPQCDSRYPCESNSKPQSGTDITMQCFKQDSDGIYQITQAEKGTTTDGYSVFPASSNTIGAPEKPAKALEGSFTLDK